MDDEFRSFERHANQPPELLSQYAPDVDIEAVLDVDVTQVGGLVPSEHIPRLPIAYSKALTTTFCLSIACSGLAFLIRFASSWMYIKK